MPMRLRVVLALMLSGLSAVLTVGGITFLEVVHRFASVEARQAEDRFRRAVHDYLAQHGDWPADGDMSAFLAELRQQLAVDASGAVRVPPDWATRAGRPPSGPAPRTGPHPPPPSLPDPSEANADTPPDAGPFDDPFRFILTDGSFKVLLGAGHYTDGAPLPEAARERAVPVQSGGRTRAYVSSEGVLSPGPEARGYLDIMRDALLYGALSATAMAVLLGLVLGRRLADDLRQLTVAVQAMGQGQLLQHVAVDGGGEVSTLARAFNAMSAELAASHDSLRASHATISAQAAQLKELSIRDPLTGLYNRRHVDENLGLLHEQAKRHRRPLTVAMADIDWFKRINDTHSHAVGDQVLRQVAMVLREGLRASDLLGRWGGEEFVIALPETPPAAGLALCEKLRLAVARFPWADIAPGLQVTLSIGLSSDAAAPSAGALLAQADMQLYRAKDEGRDRVAQGDPAPR